MTPIEEIEFARLARIERKIDHLTRLVNKLGVLMSTELDRLTASVAQQTTVEASVETLLEGLAKQLKDAAASGADAAALTALADQIDANNAKLSAAVAANTAGAMTSRPRSTSGMLPMSPPNC